MSRAHPSSRHCLTGLALAAALLSLAWVTTARPRASVRAAPSTSQRPARIVSLVPAATEMLFAMGAGPRLVGVSSYDRFPPQVDRLPRVGALIDPDLERIFELHPDLVVVYATQDDLRRQLGQAGIPVYTFVNGASLADVLATIRSLGARVGSASGAAALDARISRRIDAVKAAVAGRPRPRTLLVFQRAAFALRDIYASGGVGFLNDMLAAAGGDNVFADVKRQSVQISSETVIARAPQVILELHYGQPMSPGDMAHELAVWNVLGAVPAVRDHAVHLLVGDDLVVPGPRIAEGIERMARALHPGAFAGK
ncbi:MAG: ABC transporter substrate-binding protein [Acidobacteriota bacterium]|nr:ABC transporter substrate-binding protein [Acidobacteriota bacterium]